MHSRGCLESAVFSFVDRRSRYLPTYLPIEVVTFRFSVCHQRATRKRVRGRSTPLRRIRGSDTGYLFSWATVLRLSAPSCEAASWALYIAYDYVSIRSPGLSRHEFCGYTDALILGRSPNTPFPVIRVNRIMSLSLLLGLNAFCYLRRILSALVSEVFLGALRTLVLLALDLAVLFISRIGAKATPGFFVFMALCVLVNGNAQGMIIAGLPSLTTDLNRLETRPGKILGVLSVAVLMGPPIAGAVMEAYQGRYVYMHIWVDCSMITGGCLVMAAYISWT